MVRMLLRKSLFFFFHLFHLFFYCQTKKYQSASVVKFDQSFSLAVILNFVIINIKANENKIIVIRNNLNLFKQIEQ